MAASKTNYAAAGVSIERGDELLSRIKETVKSTHRAGVMGTIGGFAGLFDLAKTAYKDPVLVSGTDGVGTKIKLAIDTCRHHTIGIDLVAMCVNDLVVLGAEPLFFLDYFASSTLDVNTTETVISGIANGCRQSACALIGGETAEMPGMYQAGDYDLAGFCVGIAERDRLITGEHVKHGDVILALPSSGAHANGYSLIRKIIKDSGADLTQDIDGVTLIERLLEPTKIYVKEILALQQQVHLKAIAHITGGGITENLPRVLPAGRVAHINTDSWQWPELFHWIQSTGNVETAEMYRTFNCGAGMLLIVDENELENTLSILDNFTLKPIRLGYIAEEKGQKPVIFSPD